MRRTHLLRLALPAALCAAPPALAQQRADSLALARVVQFAIPNAPAFDFIGASPDEITRPTTPRALGAALVSGVTGNGRFQQGIALDVAPRQLVWPRMDLAEYQSWGGFLLANLSVSAATVQASGDTAVTNLGLGARLVLLDRTDPRGPASRRAGEEAIVRALDECLPEVGTDPSTVRDSVRACVARIDSAFQKSWRDQHWNDFALSVAAATGWGLRQSQWGDRYPLGGAIWGLGAAPLCFGLSAAAPCARGQWLAKLGWESRDSADVEKPVEQLTGGVRGTLGSAAFSVFGERLFRRRSDVPEGVRKTVREWSGGIEFKLTEDTWVSTGVGSRYDDLVAESRAVVLAGFRFNVSPKQQFNARMPSP